MSDEATEYEQEMLNKMVPSDEGLKEKVQSALMTIISYGGIDGGHHKMWTLDQVVRELVGDQYDTFIRIVSAETPDFRHGEEAQPQTH